MSKKLTPEFVAMKTKCDRLENIKNLNLWGNDLDDVSVLRNMQNLEVISLSVNRIRSLKDFSYLKNLKELYLRRNMVSDINEIEHLSNCANLRTLWLGENPVADTKNYRLNVIRILPQITKLDDVVVSAEEKSNISEEPETAKYSNNDASYESHESDPKIDNDNVFETNSMNENIDLKGYRNEEIYSNNDRNKKIKDKFSQPYAKKLSQNYTDDVVAGMDNVNIIKRDEAPVGKNFKRAYTNVEPQERIQNSAYNRANQQINQDDYQNDYYTKESITKAKKPKESANIQSTNNINERNIPGSSSNPRGGNILNCVLMLLKELNENDLEIVKTEIERKINRY